MTDNITLPREVVEKIHEAWSSEVYPPAASTEWYDIMDALRTALAAEPTKPEPVAWAYCPYTPPPSAHFGYVLGDHWLETAYSRVLDGEAEADVLRDCGWERVDEALRRDAEPTKQEPVAWLSRDEARLALWKAINSREFGNPTDDKLILDHLRQQGLWIGKVTSPVPPENEALRLDAERYKWVLDWLVRTGLLSLKTTRIDTPESYGDWFVLRKPHIIDGDSLLGYGKTEDAAIDAAMGDKT